MRLDLLLDQINWFLIVWSICKFILQQQSKCIAGAVRQYNRFQGLTHSTTFGSRFIDCPWLETLYSSTLPCSSRLRTGRVQKEYSLHTLVRLMRPRSASWLLIAFPSNNPSSLIVPVPSPDERRGRLSRRAWTSLLGSLIWHLIILLL